MAVTNYFWDPVEDNVIEEYDDKGDTIARYTTQPTLHGEVISQERNGQTSYYHYDGEGNTLALTNDAGDVTDTFAYNAFGETTERTGSTVNPFGYKGALGYYTNSETDDIYVRARMYEPKIARWTSIDPLWPETASNGFVYARNNPMRYVDPSGLKELEGKDLFLFCVKQYYTGGQLTIALWPNIAVCVIPQAIYVRSLDGDNDKYKHCMTSCYASKCGGHLVARTGGQFKELIDCITSRTLGFGGPDPEDLSTSAVKIWGNGVQVALCIVGTQSFCASTASCLSGLPSSPREVTAMARPATKFVDQLSNEDREWLMATWKSHRLHAVRCRAHAVLLSNQGWTVRELSQTFSIDEETARAWVDRWLQHGRSGLEDGPRPGAPPILNDDERKIAVGLIGQQPSNPRAVINAIADETGKTISRSTLRRLARKAGLRWKRFRKSLKQLRAPQAFQLAKDELAELTAMPDVNVAYFDEATFSLVAEVPYGWQPIGERTEIELSGKRQAIHVLAIDNESNHTTTAFLHRGSINGDTVISCIDDFAKHIRKLTVLVLDNATPHTCKKLLSHIDEWEQRGLILYPLPSYSPELNLIEHLWKKVKYTQLPITAWKTVQTLCQHLTNIFNETGRITLMPSLEVN